MVSWAITKAAREARTDQRVRSIVDADTNVSQWIGAPDLAWTPEFTDLIEEYHRLLRNFIVSNSEDLLSSEAYARLRDKFLAQRAKFEADPRYKDLFGQMGH